MEAARRLDEWRVLSKKIPSTDMIPEFVVQESREGQINLNTSEWLILSKIDGQRSIKAIAAGRPASRSSTSSKILYGLIATGLIRLRDAGRRGAGGPRRAGPPPAPAPRRGSARRRRPRPRAAAARRARAAGPAQPRARRLQRACSARWARAS